MSCTSEMLGFQPTTKQLDAKVCAAVISSLQNINIEPNGAVVHLRKLLTILKKSDVKISIQQRLSKQLLDFVSGRQRAASWSTKLLCALVLQEVLPSGDIRIEYDPSKIEEKDLTLLLPLLTLQSAQQTDIVPQLIPQLVRWVSTMGYSTDVQSQSLASLVTLVSHWPHLVSKEHVHIISMQSADWLKKASLQQAPNPYSRGLFKTEQHGLVTELDGAPSAGFFTVLSLGKYYTGEQLLNILCFSLLRQWMIPTLHHTVQEMNAPTVVEQRDRDLLTSVSTQDDSQSVQSEDLSSEGSVVTGRQREKTLLDAALQYCSRVIEQCERKPKVSQDEEIQNACLLESIQILDQLCGGVPDFLPAVYEMVKKVSARVSTSGQVVQYRVLLATLQFFLNHSCTLGHDDSDIFDVYFGKILASTYTSPSLAFDTVTFLETNLAELSQRLTLLTKYFPNILKILAWNPRCFLREFLVLVPAFMSSNTAVEVLHALLDLPCMTAALELSQATTAYLGGDRTNPPPAMTVYQDQRHKPWFNFILRNQAGFGDTIDRLGILHNMLEDWKHTHRVTVCDDVVSPLLQVYFDVVKEEGGFELASRLVPVILERSGLLYGIPHFQQQVKKLLANSLLQLYQQYPQLLMNQYTETLDYVSNARNLTDQQQLFTNLVWIIGEYMSCQWDSHCTPDIICKMYEALETLSYEVTGSLQGVTEVTFNVRMLTTMMSTLAKLASRSQDLIPRVILCLTRLSQEDNVCVDRTDRQVLHSRANELINLLKLPNVAAVILTPSPDLETGRLHQDGSSLSSLLKTTNHFLQARTH